MKDGVLKSLIDAGVYVTFSVDGPPEIHNSLRPLKNGHPSAHILEKNMKKYLNNSGHRLTVRTTITNTTADNIHDILDYFKNLGVSKIHLEPLYLLGRAIKKELDRPTPKKWHKTIMKALKWAKSNDLTIQIGELSHLFSPSQRAYCGPMNGSTLVVNHQGLLTSCSEVSSKKNEEWNVFQYGNINGLKIDQVKYAHLNQRTSSNMSSCRECYARYICKSGCAHKSFMATGDLFEPDPYHCDHILEVIPELIVRMATGNY